jgi:hypothetical protein
MRAALSPRAAATAVLLALAAPASAQGNPRAEALLAQLPFSAAEQRRIQAGELVTTASRERTSNRELAITMAFLIRDPPADLASMFEKAYGYDADQTVTAHGELHGDGSLADLQALRLTPNGDAEARRFAEASPGTDLNLSTEEIAAFRALPERTTAAVEAELRRMLLARYQAYRARGLAGIQPYARSRGRSTNPADDLRRATEASPVLAREAPEVVRALLDFPRSQPAKSTESFLWVNFDIDRRPTIALTHRLIIPQNDGTLVFVDRHYYVSRSHNAVQKIAGIFPVQEGAMVIYANRTFTDQLGGVGASTKQAIGRRMMSSQLAAFYEQLRSRPRR